MANKFNIGDTVRYTGIEPQFPVGATGVVHDVDGIFPGSILAVNETEGYVMGITEDVAELVEPTIDELDAMFRELFGGPVEAPEDVKVGDRVRVSGFSADTDGLEGTVIALPDDDDSYFEVEVDDRPLSFGEGYLLERDEFELIDDEAKAKAELEQELKDFEVLVGRLIGAAKKSTDQSLAAVLETLAVGFAIDPNAGPVIRELIGKGDAA